MIAVLVLSTGVIHHPSYAADHFTNQDPLIQDQLYIYEYTRDIEKTKMKIQTKKTEIEKLQHDLTRQENQFAKKQEEMGSFLRETYMQDHPPLLTMLLGVDNVKHLIATLNFISFMVERDQRVVDSYHLEKERLNHKLTEVKRENQHLSRLESKLYDDLLEVQTRTLKYPSKDVLSAKVFVDDLLHRWDNVGLPTFETIFRELSASISSLPEIIDPENITSSGFFSRQVILSDQDLNSYLISKNPVFNQILFTFEDDQVKVKGYFQGQSLEIQGQYLVLKNHVDFVISTMIFNEISLPPVTIDDMNERYDLGFYPEEIMKGIRVKEISAQDGILKLVVSL